MVNFIRSIIGNFLSDSKLIFEGSGMKKREYVPYNKQQGRTDVHSVLLLVGGGCSVLVVDTAFHYNNSGEG